MKKFLKNVVRQNKIKSESSSEDDADFISLSDVVVYDNLGFTENVKRKTFNWNNLKESEAMISDEIIISINDCPSIDLFLTNFSHLLEQFLNKNESVNCLHVKVDQPDLFLNETQYIDLINHLHNVNKSLLIAFDSMVNFSSSFFWKLKDLQQILTVDIEAKSSDIRDFVLDFIVKSLKNNHNGLNSAIHIQENQLTVQVSYDMLGDSQNRNLLFLSAQVGNLEVVKFLLDHFEVNQTVDGTLPVDLAFQSKKFETVLALLKANSKFPKGIDEAEDLPFDLRKFLISCKSMHHAIDCNNEQEVSSIVQQNPGLKYFFNLDNQSALAVALEKRAFGIYKILVTKNVSLGPNEWFEDIMETYSTEERRELSEINISNVQNLKEPYILKLLANSNVGLDDELKETRCAHVLKAFESLNKIEEIKYLLKFTASQENFQLVFDFNRDHVQFLDPKAESYCNGLFYLNGRILIGAMYLLDEERVHEVYGVIAHEICHFVMFKVFDNWAKPYNKNDLKTAESFKEITSYCEVLQDFDEIVSLVFTAYDEDQQHAELIVRIPHLFGHYYDNPEKLKEVKENLSELYRFYNEQCIRSTQQALKHEEQKSSSQSTVLKETKNLKIFKSFIVYGGFIILFIYIYMVKFWYSKSDEILKSCNNTVDATNNTILSVRDVFKKICTSSNVTYCLPEAEKECDTLVITNVCSELVTYLCFFILCTRVALCQIDGVHKSRLTKKFISIILHNCAPLILFASFIMSVVVLSVVIRSMAHQCNIDYKDYNNTPETLAEDLCSLNTYNCKDDIKHRCALETLIEHIAYGILYFLYFVSLVRLILGLLKWFQN